MRFCSLGSGSSGNATLVEASQGITTTRLLIDAGFSARELQRRLERTGCTLADLDAVFITHEHGDHVGCALTLAQRHRLPVITSAGTWRAIGGNETTGVNVHLLKAGQAFRLGDLELHPFAVPHDALEPLQLTLTDGAGLLGVVTDLGSTPPAVAAALAGCHALLLECNHDEAMLRAGPYPPSLKRRILGTHGHLSNDAAAALLAACRHAGLRTVAAAHLSERNNSPQQAREALMPVLGCSADDIPVADPAQGLDWISVG